MKKTLLFLIPFFTYASCNCVEGTGPVNTKDFNLEDIRGVHLTGNTDLKLTQGSPQSVSLTAQQNILDLVEITVNDGIAYISSKTCYQSSKDNYLAITIPRIEELSLKGAGDIMGQGRLMLSELDVELDGAGDVELEVDAAALNIEINGAGDVNLKGETKELEVDVNGAGDVMAKELKSEEAELSINGAGDIEAYATVSLNATINGAGSIRHKGNAKVNSNVNGVGSVSPF